jgi:hypothetical protein
MSVVLSKTSLWQYCVQFGSGIPCLLPDSSRHQSLNIPANNCAILQRGDDLELLQAGQHCVTNPNVTLRGLYTLGENQFEMPTKDMCAISIHTKPTHG